MAERVKEYELDGRTYQINKFPLRQGLRLDKKVVALITPVLKGLGEMSKEEQEEDVSLAMLADGIHDVLTELDDDLFEKFVLELLSSTLLVNQGAANIPISGANLDLCFDKYTSIYKLIFEVMKFNKFTPFEMVEGGFGMGTTNGLESPMQRLSKIGEQLVK